MELTEDYAQDLERLRALQGLEDPEYFHRSALAYLMVKHKDLDPIDPMSLTIAEVHRAWQVSPEDIEQEMPHFWDNNFQAPLTRTE